MRDDASNYYEVTFTEPAIAKLKANWKTKNDKIKTNRLDVDVATRWIGTAGETAFNRWLKLAEADFDWHLKEDVPDELDFSINNVPMLYIDVKTAASDYEPKPHYRCSVNDDQWQSALEKGLINIFVFARYITPARKIQILGWITVAEFAEVSVFHEKGEQINATTKCNTDMRDIMISELHQIDSKPQPKRPNDAGTLYEFGAR
ncbi:hypothetical protein [Polynucleobacter sp.]|uniref:hypothetical protein n=1 Tax=Polynucleobacter sp. TaxID=2029855 RepID=UPI003F697EF1